MIRREGYTSSMKTSVSIPDPIFRQAEELAAELDKSRSELYTEAIQNLVARHDPRRLTDRLNQAYGGADQDTSLADAAAREGLSRVEW